MGDTKSKLKRGDVTLGGWAMIGHPSIVEILAGEGFDWICVDMEHTSISVHTFHEMALAGQGTGVDIIARLPAHDPKLAKQVLDCGAAGIIVASVNSPEEAGVAVATAKFPTEGNRGASLCRASDYGRNFEQYYQQHNDNVLVVCMLEHVDAVTHVDAILKVPGIGATFIGPYDLSASMGLPGKLDHPDVLAAPQTLLDACKKQGVPPGLHVVQADRDQLQQCVAEGFRFIGCGIDTEFLMFGCRAMLDR